MRIPAFLTITALLAACATAHPPAAGDVAAIRAARAEQNHAIASGDADRIASFWTDDVTVRSGLGALVTGRASYRERIVANGLTYIRTPASIDVSDHWPLAYESGTWTAYRAGAEIMAGRYAAQWVRRDGRWLIRSEVFVALTCRAGGCEGAAVP
jgi:ketosteroid isomerase-like protein